MDPVRQAQQFLGSEAVGLRLITELLATARQQRDIIQRQGAELTKLKAAPDVKVERARKVLVAAFNALDD